MTINKVVIAKGIYLDKELRLLVSFDEKDNAIDIINIDASKVGMKRLGKVEKVLKDIDASILVFDNKEKGFIENKKLKSQEFIERHSENKKVCQGDSFYVCISQDPKGTKPYSCNFCSENYEDRGVVAYYIHKFANKAKIITDIPNLQGLSDDVLYKDDQVSLWDLYEFTSILNKSINKVAFLKNGGNILIEETEAMTVIDVNSGKNYGKDNFLKTNILAAQKIAIELRRRSISGIIIVDFLKVSPKEEAQIIEVLNSSFQDDMSNVAIHGFTRLGLMEITRSRIYAPISQSIPTRIES
ncbi:MAG: ribonuclease E/G [Pseudobutyrivibrio sp.]|nr:ribonuclease E/G [Pseudobutyrivibrio sp.]